MPDKYRVALSDGRTFDVVTEGGAPSEADVLASLSQTPHFQTSNEVDIHGNPIVRDAEGHTAAENAILGDVGSLYLPDIVKRWGAAGPLAVASGAKDVQEGNVAKGLNQIIRGGAVTAIPFSLPALGRALVVNTAPTVMSLLGGGGGAYVAGQVAKPIAESAGATPDQAELAQTVAEAGGGWAGSKITPQQAKTAYELAQALRHPWSIPGKVLRASAPVMGQAYRDFWTAAGNPVGPSVAEAVGAEAPATVDPAAAALKQRIAAGMSASPPVVVPTPAPRPSPPPRVWTPPPPQAPPPEPVVSAPAPAPAPPPTPVRQWGPPEAKNALIAAGQALDYPITPSQIKVHWPAVQQGGPDEAVAIVQRLKAAAVAPAPVVTPAPAVVEPPVSVAPAVPATPAPEVAPASPAPAVAGAPPMSGARAEQAVYEAAAQMGLERVNLRDVAAAGRLVREGVTPEEALTRVLGGTPSPASTPTDPAAELAARLGLPTDARAAATIDARYAKGQLKTPSAPLATAMRQQAPVVASPNAAREAVASAAPTGATAPAVAPVDAEAGPVAGRVRVERAPVAPGGVQPAGRAGARQAAAPGEPVVAPAVAGEPPAPDVLATINAEFDRITAPSVPEPPAPTVTPPPPTPVKPARVTRTKTPPATVETPAAAAETVTNQVQRVIDIAGAKSGAAVQARVLQALQQELAPAQEAAGFKDITTVRRGGGGGSILVDGEPVAYWEKGGAVKWFGGGTGMHGAKIEAPDVLEGVPASTPIGKYAINTRDMTPSEVERAMKNAVAATVSQARGAGQLTVSVPGDGTFTIERNPHAIQQLMQKLTSAGGGIWKDVAGGSR